MPIARKPSGKPAIAPDEAAEQFIARAGTPAAAANQPLQSEPAPGASGEKRQPAMIRFDRDLLARVDQAAKRRGVSRSAWIQFVLSKALDEGDA